MFKLLSGMSPGIISALSGRANTLDGPHGMHPVGDTGEEFADGGHEDMAENNEDACRACHGRVGEGTVLAAMHQDRVLNCDERTPFCPSGDTQLLPKGHQVTCSDCHENELDESNHL